jgi:hypothetical protein
MIRAAQNGLTRSLSLSLSPFVAASSKAWPTLLGGCGSQLAGQLPLASCSVWSGGNSNCSNNKYHTESTCSHGRDVVLCSPMKALQASCRPFSSLPRLVELAVARRSTASTANDENCLGLSLSPRWISSKPSSYGGGGKKSKKVSGESKDRNSAADSTSTSPHADAPSQHEEWVAFQRTISVQGFETGQQTQVASRSKRGGRLVRRKQQKLRERDEDDPYDPRRFTDLAGGEFPPHRYSQEETERLLAQAYANLPERAGKRGTRNLKRQGRRWFLVRKVRKLYKHHLANFQTRKMAKRSEKVRLVKQVLEEAPDKRQSDRQYQAQVFASWSSRMEQRRVGAGVSIGA